MHTQGLSVWIEVYDDPRNIEQSTPLPAIREEIYEGGKRASCYVQAEEGQYFKICTQVDDTVKCDLRIMTTMDGTRMDTSLKSNRSMKKGKPVRSVKGVRTADGHLPFRFGKLATADDDDEACCRDDGVINKLGSIVVEVWRVRKDDNPQPQTHFTIAKPAPVVSEKVKKKINTSVEVSTSVIKTAVPATTGTCTYLDARRRPFAIFTFRYRTQIMLQILKIIPDDVESDLDGVERIASISASRTATTSRTPPAQAAPSRIVRSINGGAPAQAGNTSGRVIIVADGDEEEEDELTRLRRENAALKETNERIEETNERIKETNERIQVKLEENGIALVGGGVKREAYECQTNGQTIDLVDSDEEVEVKKESQSTRPAKKVKYEQV